MGTVGTGKASPLLDEVSSHLRAAHGLLAPGENGVSAENVEFAEELVLRAREVLAEAPAARMLGVADSKRATQLVEKGPDRVDEILAGLRRGLEDPEVPPGHTTRYGDALQDLDDFARETREVAQFSRWPLSSDPEFHAVTAPAAALKTDYLAASTQAAKLRLQSLDEGLRFRFIRSMKTNREADRLESQAQESYTKLLSSEGSLSTAARNARQRFGAIFDTAGRYGIGN